MSHDPWHELLHLAAAVVLAGGGSIFVVLAVLDRRRRPAGPSDFPVEPPAGPPPAEVGSLLTILAAALSVAAAAVHLAAAPAHLEELGEIGWGFVGAAVFQAAWALAYGILPSRGLAAVGIAGSLAILAAWLVSRSVGLPVGGLAGVPEAVGMPDAAATAFELLLVGLLAGRWLALRHPIAGRVRDAAGLATVALVPTVGIVFLAATLAVSAALGHEHGPGETHGAGAHPPGGGGAAVQPSR